MISISPGIRLDDDEIKWEFIRSSGPGGQNVNKVASAVQLRFDIANSPSITTEVKERLLALYPGSINNEQVLIIDARRFRSQKGNRKDALDRLANMLQKAAEKPRARHPTRPTAASRERRLEFKRRRSQSKRGRSAASKDYEE
jgi:ribosome-associated protein